MPSGLLATLLNSERGRQIIAEARSSGMTWSDFDCLTDHLELTVDDTLELLDELERIGITLPEIEGERDQAAADAAFLAAMDQWIADGNPMPSLTAEGWASLQRARGAKKL